MQFHLIYNGPLSANSGPEQKHAIRLQLHPQLVELWKYPPLRYYHEAVINVDLLQQGAPDNRSALYECSA
jgi:hypothetical protein